MPFTRERAQELEERKSLRKQRESPDRVQRKLKRERETEKELRFQKVRELKSSERERINSCCKQFVIMTILLEIMDVVQGSG